MAKSEAHVLTALFWPTCLAPEVEDTAPGCGPQWQRKLEVSSETTMPPSTGQLENYICPPGNKNALSYRRAQKEGQLNYLLFLSIQLIFQGQDGATNSLLYHLCREVLITESATTSTLVTKPLPYTL